jgi:predicted enzyme related to lactoylglutathione lyase
MLSTKLNWARPKPEATSAFRLVAVTGDRFFIHRRKGQVDMKVTQGTNWIIHATNEFEKTLSFFQDVMGLTLKAEGEPQTDTQFKRYAQMQLPGGGVLELIEPEEAFRELYAGPIISLTVENVEQARNELKSRQGTWVSPLFITAEGWGWTYFKTPDGHVYQVQGSCKPDTE